MVGVARVTKINNAYFANTSIGDITKMQVAVT